MAFDLHLRPLLRYLSRLSIAIQVRFSEFISGFCKFNILVHTSIFAKNTLAMIKFMLNFCTILGFNLHNCDKNLFLAKKNPLMSSSSHIQSVLILVVEY